MLLAGRPGVAGSAPTRVQGAAPGVRLGARGLLDARRKGSRLCGLVGGAVAVAACARGAGVGVAVCRVHWACGVCRVHWARGGLLDARRKGDFFCVGWWAGAMAQWPWRPVRARGWRGRGSVQGETHWAREACCLEGARGAAMRAAGALALAQAALWQWRAVRAGLAWVHRERRIGVRIVFIVLIVQVSTPLHKGR